jgi:c-di-GMP-binding flagellar brake protein YcgR
MRMPISRVRSVTDTSMMFITPMPPTTSDTSAMEDSSRVTVSCVDVSMLVISAMVLVEKSSSWSASMRCRSRSSVVIS